MKTYEIDIKVRVQLKDNWVPHYGPMGNILGFINNDDDGGIIFPNFTFLQDKEDANYPNELAMQEDGIDINFDGIETEKID